MEIIALSVKKMQLKVPSGKQISLCLDLNVLSACLFYLKLLYATVSQSANCLVTVTDILSKFTSVSAGWEERHLKTSYIAEKDNEFNQKHNKIAIKKIKFELTPAQSLIYHIL